VGDAFNVKPDPCHLNVEPMMKGTKRELYMMLKKVVYTMMFLVTLVS
jgi:hypothetical protein